MSEKTLENQINDFIRGLPETITRIDIITGLWNLLATYIIETMNGDDKEERVAKMFEYSLNKIVNEMRQA